MQKKMKMLTHILTGTSESDCILTLPLEKNMQLFQISLNVPKLHLFVSPLKNSTLKSEINSVLHLTLNFYPTAHLLKSCLRNQG